VILNDYKESFFYQMNNFLQLILTDLEKKKIQCQKIKTSNILYRESDKTFLLVKRDSEFNTFDWDWELPGAELWTTDALNTDFIKEEQKVIQQMTAIDTNQLSFLNYRILETKDYRYLNLFFSATYNSPIQFWSDDHSEYKMCSRDEAARLLEKSGEFIHLPPHTNQ
jgi:hypothetical protein